MTNEQSVKSLIRRELGLLPDVKLFTNPVGNGWTGGLVLHKDGIAMLYSPRRVEYGLVKGSADLIGWRSITIRPEHVGMTFARFLSLEIKTDTGRPTPDQLTWQRNVTAAGGIASIVRSVEEAKEAIG